MAGCDDPTVSDMVLLERCHQLAVRDALSRAPDDAKARMDAAGCPGTDWAPLTTDDHLELLRTRRWLEQRMGRRQTEVLRARQAGVSWEAIAAAVEQDVVTARDQFAAWIDGQQTLHDSIGIGLDDDQAGAAWLLIEDDDPVGAR